MHFLHQIEGLLLNLMVDSEEVDRKPLGKDQPKGNCLKAIVSAWTLNVKALKLVVLGSNLVIECLKL